MELRRKKYARVTAVALALCVLMLVWLLPVRAADTVQMTVTYRQTEARKVLGEVNAFRQSSEAWYWNEDNRTKTVCSGLKAYVYDYDLEQIAMQRAVETAAWVVLGCRAGDTPHTRPNGRDWNTVVLANGVQSYGECLAAGQGLLKSAADVVEVWKETDEDYAGQSHRRGMLEDSTLRVAIGVACVTYGDWTVWAMEFGESTNAAATAAVNSTVKASVPVQAKDADKGEKDAPAVLLNGLVKGPSGWAYYKDGVVDTSVTTVMKNNYGWWRVLRGYVDWDANGIYRNSYGWWKTTGGKVTFHENGVFKNEYGWWKVKDSKVDFGFTGVASNQYGTWYIEKGKVNFSKNGKIRYGGKTYTVVNGRVK